MVKDCDKTFESLEKRIDAAHDKLSNRKYNSHTDILTNLAKKLENVKGKEEKLMKSERIAKSESARTRRAQLKKIVIERTQRIYSKLRKIRKSNN